MDERIRAHAHGGTRGIKSGVWSQEVVRQEEYNQEESRIVFGQSKRVSLNVKLL